MTKKLADELKGLIEEKFGVEKEKVVDVETANRKEEFKSLTSLLANQVLKQELTARHRMGSKITSKEVFEELAKRREIFRPYFANFDDVGYRTTLKSEIAKICQEYSLKNEEIKGFDPSTLSIEEAQEVAKDAHDFINNVDFNRKEKVRDLIKSLETSVVRLVFKKKGTPIKDSEGKVVVDENGKPVMDTEYREMWATRNPNLIKLYSKDVRDKGKTSGGALDDLTKEDKIEYQIEKDLVRVLDIQKEEFRAFKPSTLYKVDAKAGVGSWIEFDIDDDAWFVLAKDEDNKKPISAFSDGSRHAKKTGIKSAKRLQYEKEAIATGQASGGLPTNEEEREIKDNTLAAEQGLIAFKKVTYGVFYGETYDELLEGMKLRLKTLAKDRNPKIIEYDAEISVSAVKDDKTTMVLNVAGSQILVNPFFIVNVKTGRKYLDRYDIFRFGRVNTTLPYALSDKLVENELEQLARDLSEIKKGKKRARTIHEVDKKRLARMNFIATDPSGKAWLASLNTRLKMNSTGKFELVIGKGKSKVGFIIHPSYLVMINPVDNKPIYLIKTVRYTSLISEWRDKIITLKATYKQYPQIIEALNTIDAIFLTRVFSLKVRFEKLIPAND